ncbi:MAG: hypothetical protein IKW96_14730 [Ruminococcus sp.]|uniref:hypothetical protein n=1 Tax=Ruminococcus sp. TaxID=41978 RepID=UPI0025F5CE1C|nr:hypothetical protein [Ruminococcus sp.]MBR5684507.1 hypothetical protein [Ruminococcus sp.]
MTSLLNDIIIMAAADHTAISAPLKKLLILIGAIVVILILIILLFSSKSKFRRFLSIFLEEQPEEEMDGGSPHRGAPAAPAQRRAAPEEEFVQKRTSEPIVEMATLVRKSDDRLRIIESSGQIRLVDEYYELIFVTRKGQKLKIECSAEAYDKIPFNQQGSLTYKRNTLVKFKYYEDTVFN